MRRGRAPASADADRTIVLARLGVSRETSERLDIFVGLLRRWQNVQNLVAPSTLDAIWTRHILDSAQLLPLCGSAHRIADLGSGAGFPGLVLAILQADAATRVHLIESNGRKAAFLREAVLATGAPATVHSERAEAVLPEIGAGIGMITARALAPLVDLLALSEGLLKTGSEALFLKGQDIDKELTGASKSWRIEVDLIQSVTDPTARIVHVRRAERLVVA